MGGAGTPRSDPSDRVPPAARYAAAAAAMYCARACRAMGRVRHGRNARVSDTDLNEAAAQTPGTGAGSMSRQKSPTLRLQQGPGNGKVAADVFGYGEPEKAPSVDR